MSRTTNILASLGLSDLPLINSETVSILLWAREVMQKHQATTYAVRDPKGIEELKSVKIGGVDQWVHIRGRNRDNPVLLWLHGGPGGSVIGHGLDAVQRPWEDYFTVVLWDQRQTGKSYYPAQDETECLSVQQFVDDTEELMQYLRDYLEKDKLFIVGASWGTNLGMHMVKRHPDWIHAYVGIGQVVNSIDNERVLYERLLSHAKEKNEHKLLEALERMPKIWELDSPEREKANTDYCMWMRREISRLAGESAMHHMPYEDMLRMVSFDGLISPHRTFSDINNALFGQELALFREDCTLAKDFLDIDLPKDIGSSFDVPIFFFTGSHDWQVPVSLSDQWFSEINAPYKELIHFEESSHFLVNEEPGKFLVSLVNKVLPFMNPMLDKKNI